MGLTRERRGEFYRVRSTRDARRGCIVIRRNPFALRTQRPKHLADANGAISAADEIAELNRLAAAEWIWRHDANVTVDALLARIAEVGTDVATAEALAGRPPTRRAY